MCDSGHFIVNLDSYWFVLALFNQNSRHERIQVARKFDIVCTFAKIKIQGRFWINRLMNKNICSSIELGIILYTYTTYTPKALGRVFYFYL